MLFRSLLDFKAAITVLIAGLMLMVLLPPACFLFQMTRARRRGLIRYGRLGSRYVQQFAHKWLQQPDAAPEGLLGSPDIQSLADLANAYEVVLRMRPVPITLRVLVQVAVALALPLAPLLLTMVSLEDVVSRAMEFLF